MKHSLIFSAALFALTGLAGYTQVSSAPPAMADDAVLLDAALAQADAANQYRYQVAQSTYSSGGFGRGGGMMGGMGMSGFGGEFGESGEKQEVRVFALQYYKAQDMVGILRNVSPIGAVPDMRNNNLIVTGTPEQLALVESLIQAIDKESTQEQRVEARFNLLYQIYMVEQEVQESNLRRFTVTLKMSGKPLDTTLFNQELNSESLIITDINSVRAGLQLVSSQPGSGLQQEVEVTETVFEGKAASMNDLKTFVEKIHAFTSEVPEVRSFGFEDTEAERQDSSSNAHDQLPDNVKGHLEKLLGDSLTTVGYWFGNTSNTGNLTAPVGEWSVSLQSMYTDNNNLDLEIQLSGGNHSGGRTVSSFGGPVPESYPRPRSSPDQLFYTADAAAELPGTTPRRNRRYTDSYAAQPGAMARAGSSNSTILQNTVKSQIGKPIIIGYNRETGSGRRMGALVIVPEMDDLTGSSLQSN